MLLNVFNLTFLLLCCRILQIECCTKTTFVNTTITIATRSHHSLPSFKTAITGCITPEIISQQLGQVTIIQIYCVNENIPRLYENAVSNLSELTTLIFRYSKIKRINNKAFFNLPKLTTLDLGGNEIATIDQNAFQNLDLLQYIHLQGNKIVFLEHGIFANLPNLHTITLARNELEAFDQEWFGQSFELHSVNISNNLIRTIQKQTFKPFKSLLNIDLGSNHIHYIDKEAFDGLENLSSLFLHGNRIQKLHQDVFQSLKQLSTLWLHRNNLTYISDKTLKGLANNRLNSMSMSIHTNPWQCGCYDKILKWAQEISVYINTVAECYNEENAVCVIPAENEDMCLEEREEDLNSLFYKSFNHRCVLKVENTCQLPPEVGECGIYTDRWYYDIRDKTCRQFYYGGCGGNANNFQTEHICQQRCEIPATTAPPEVEPQPQPQTPEPPQPQPPIPGREEPFKEGLYILPNCTDNQFFANCALIVKSHFCDNKYYAQFCCKSCTEAGQLPSVVHT